MKILITNSVPLNGGDEALLRATVESLQLKHHDAEITVLCSDVARARSLIPDLHFQPDLEFATGPDERQRVSEFYRSTDIVLSAPGGFLHDFYDVLPRLRGFEVAIALGKPVILFAQSVGPFWKDESLRRVPEVLNRVSLICVRDAFSRQHLINCGIQPCKIRETADAAFLWRRLAPELYRPKVAPVRNIALAFRTWPIGDDVEAERTLVKAEQLCRHILRDPERHLAFISTCQGINGYFDDSLLARRIIQRLSPDLQKRCSVDAKRYTPRELIEVYSQFDAYVGMRLHGSILSMLGGTPAMGLGYEQKTAEVFEQLGLTRYQVRFETHEEHWIRCVDRFLAEIEHIRTVLPAALDCLAGRAQRNIEAVASVMEQRTCRSPLAASEAQETIQTDPLPPLPLAELGQLARQIGAERVLVLGSVSVALRRHLSEMRYVACGSRIPQERDGVPFYECQFDRQDLPADLQELELILCIRVLEQLNGILVFLKHLRSRLRPGGALIVTCSMDRGDVTSLIGSAGFKVETTLTVSELAQRRDAHQTVSAGTTTVTDESKDFYLPDEIVFVARKSAEPGVPVERICAVIPAGASFILVDDARWADATFPKRLAIPFLERNGEYWGPPGNAEEAVCELERMRRQGAEFIVFADESLWWLQHYHGLAQHLACHFRKAAEDWQFTVFELSDKDL